MKPLYKTVILIVSMIIMASCHKVEYEGNTGKILHTKFDPIINLNLASNDSSQSRDTAYLDFNKDGQNDMKVFLVESYQYAVCVTVGDWEICSIIDDTSVNEIPEYEWKKNYSMSPFHKHFVRHKVDEGFCYGWVHTYMLYGNEGQSPVTRFYIEDIAYCTCPNYPIKWGE